MSDNKIPENYKSFVDYVNNASKEELQKLAIAIQENLPEQDKNLIYGFVKELKKGTPNIDTSSEEKGKKR